MTLTASPDSGSVFTGWAGACIGTGACEVTMEQAKSVTANFARPAPATIADVSLKLSGPRNVKLGKTLTYRFTVRNLSKSQVPDATVIGSPSGLSMESMIYTKMPGFCRANGPTLTCSLYTLKSRQKQTFTVKVKPVLRGALAYNTQITANVNDPNVTNNSATLSTIVK